MDDSTTAAGAGTPVKKGTLRLVTAIAGSILFFCLISPTAVPLVMLIVGFIMLGVLLYGIVKLVLVASGLGAKLRPMQRRGVVLMGVCLPLLLMMLQSVGQLTIRDTLTLGGLFVVGIFYILRFGTIGRS